MGYQKTTSSERKGLIVLALCLLLIPLIRTIPRNIAKEAAKTERTAPKPVKVEAAPADSIMLRKGRPKKPAAKPAAPPAPRNHLDEGF